MESIMIGNIIPYQIKKKVFCFVADGTVCFSTYVVRLHSCTSTANMSQMSLIKR